MISIEMNQIYFIALQHFSRITYLALSLLGVKEIITKSGVKMISTKYFNSDIQAQVIII